MTEPGPKINAPEPLSAARASPHLAEMKRLTELWADAAIMQGRHPRAVVCLALIDTIVRIMTNEDPPMSHRSRREMVDELYAAADKILPPLVKPAP
jgi:hypothetical protein